MTWGPVILSLRVSAFATAIVVIVGVSVGYMVAKSRIPGARAIEGIFTLPMVMPPTVTGYYLLATMRIPWLEETWLDLFGTTLAFTFTGIVIAASVEALPYCLRASRAAIASVDPRLERAARCMGLKNLKVAARVTLPLAGRGIVAGAALGFVRALGDFGATLLVGSAIPDRTYTLPIVVYGAVVTDPAPATAFRSSMILCLIAVAVLFFVNRFGRATL